MIKRYRVFGRVQGVGFRAFVLRQAGQLGLDGWVRNMGDGSVESLVDASEAAHAAFEAVLRKGPRYSEVQLVLVVDEPEHSQLPGGFTVSHDRG